MSFSCSDCRFDRELGGFEMDLRLRDHLAKLFNEQKKSKKDVRENHRAMAKLLKEAQRLKTVLSANVDFMAQVSTATWTCNPQSILLVVCLTLMLYVRSKAPILENWDKCPTKKLQIITHQHTNTIFIQWKYFYIWNKSISISNFFFFFGVFSFFFFNF